MIGSTLRNVEDRIAGLEDGCAEEAIVTPSISVELLLVSLFTYV